MPIYRFFGLRKLIRDTMRPIPLSKAKKWDTILGRIYTVSAFCSFLGVTYMIYDGKTKMRERREYEETSAEYYVRILGLKDVNVARISFEGGTPKVQHTFARTAADLRQPQPEEMEPVFSEELSQKE